MEVRARASVSFILHAHSDSDRDSKARAQARMADVLQTRTDMFPAPRMAAIRDALEAMLLHGTAIALFQPHHAIHHYFF
jgi:hypothetical protein